MERRQKAEVPVHWRFAERVLEVLFELLLLTAFALWIAGLAVRHMKISCGSDT